MVSALPPQRLPLWGLLDSLEAAARASAGALESNEAHVASAYLEREGEGRVPVVIVVLRYHALVALPKLGTAHAEIYGHKGALEWQVVHEDFPHPVDSRMGDLLFGLAQSWWQRRAEGKA